MRTVSDNEFEQATCEYGGFINYIVSKYHIRGYDKDDLRQEFLQILYKCLQFYRNGTGAKFITYYTTAIHWWIRRQLIRVEYRYDEIKLNADDFINEYASDEDVEINVFLAHTCSEITNYIRSQKYGEFVIEILYGHTSVKETAKLLNVSTQRVSQICKYIKDKAKIELREELKEYEGFKLSCKS